MTDFRRMMMYGVPAAALAFAVANAFATGAPGAADARAGATAVPVAATTAGAQDMRVSQILGKQVMDRDGRSLGEVKDLLIDTRDGRIAYALLSGGEAFDPPGDRLVQVPVNEAKATLRDGRFHAGIHAGRLAGYPTIDPRAWEDRKRATAAPGVAQPLRRATEVLDAKLLDRAGRRVGEVEDVVVSLEDGSVRYGVAEFDPSWFQRGKLVALPVDAIEADPKGGNDLVLRIQRGDLARAPAFDRDRWPQMGDRHFVQRVKDFFTAG